MLSGEARGLRGVIKHDRILWDELVNLILLHYEKFDSKYKGMMPLKRVYVPEPLEGGD